MTSRLSKAPEGEFPPRHPDERVRMHRSSHATQIEAFMENSMLNHAMAHPDLTEYIWGWCDEHQKWCVMLVRFKPGTTVPTQPEKEKPPEGAIEINGKLFCNCEACQADARTGGNRVEWIS